MKSIVLPLTLAVFSAVGPLAADDAPGADPAPPASQPPPSPGSASKDLKLNFRGVPLEAMLDYLSEAAGFVIVLETKVTGTADLWSEQPVSKDEAVDLLNAVLAKNGYASIRNGRTLTIVGKDEAKGRAIPVKTGADPEKVPMTDEMVTQIIPIRFVEAAQLVKDVSTLVPTTTIVANEAGNSIIVTDTQANIRHLMEIIKAVDSSAEDSTEVRVFRLKHADPSEMVDLLNNLFPDDSRSGQNAQTPVRFGGGFGNRGGFGGFGGGGGFGGFGGFGGAGGAARAGTATGGSADRIKKHMRVIAAADLRTSSLIVSAAKDLIGSIAEMVDQLDKNPAQKQSVAVFHLQNADPQQVQTVLQGIFQKNLTTRSQTTTQNSQLQTRQNNNTQVTSGGTSSFGSGSTGGNRGTGAGGF
jgi:general secretion pathway protein D